jgi:hypothetical protein
MNTVRGIDTKWVRGVAFPGSLKLENCEAVVGRRGVSVDLSYLAKGNNLGLVEIFFGKDQRRIAASRFRRRC